MATPGTLGSECLKQADYNAERQELTLEFQNGGTYRYSDVPLVVFLELLQAKSRGSYFYYEIRKQYDYIRLSDWAEVPVGQEEPLTVWLSGGPVDQEAADLAAHNSRCERNWAEHLQAPPGYEELARALKILSNMVLGHSGDPETLEFCLKGAAGIGRDLACRALGESE
jgi:hypothetical protein